VGKFFYFRRPSLILKKAIMFKTLLSLILLLGSAGAVSAQKAKQTSKTASKSQVKFLDDIEVEIAPSSVEQRSELSEFEKQYFAKNTTTAKSTINSNLKIENASKVQIKYALILDTEVEQIENVNLYAGIDEWMGTRYRLGGSTKDGIDCSALVQILYVTQFGANLPRTAREQYDATQRISRTDLKEGDLVFFNTTGGVSHVGIYLKNNKFVHASSGGVTISDLFEPYWEKRFIGVGRYAKSQPEMAFTSGNL
jgi:cell wall-associated NlpC family hydrolase